MTTGRGRRPDPSPGRARDHDRDRGRDQGQDPGPDRGRARDRGARDQDPGQKSTSNLIGHYADLITLQYYLIMHLKDTSNMCSFIDN